MKKFALVFALALAMLLTVSALAADPVISIDFADGAGDVELVNAEIVSDVTRGNVLKVNGQGPGTNRSSYGLYKTDVFENTDWENGLTVSCWIQTDVGSETLDPHAPIISIDATMAPQGYISAIISGETTMNTDGNQPETGISPRCWNDPNWATVNRTEEGIWQLLTVVYDPIEDNVRYYLDDELINTQTLGGGTIDYVLFELEFYDLVRLGSWGCTWWNTGDYEGMIDDVAIYATALTEDEIVDRLNATKVAQTVVIKAPTLEEKYTAADHTPVAVIDFEDASAFELNNAELVNGRTGKAVKIKGSGPDNTGSSYALYNTDLFKNTDWSKGVTLNFWVNADASDTLTGTAPYYSFDLGNQGYIATVCSIQSAINTDGNQDIGIVPRFWNDPANIGSSTNDTTPGEWTLITVVYNEGGKSMAIYKNGEAVGKPGINLGTQFGEGTPEQFFEQVGMVETIRFGSWLCDWWKFGDYEGMIDDFEIYNEELNPLEVKYLFTGKPDAAETPAEPAVEKTISMPKTEFTVGEPVLVTATGEGTDWVGLYKEGDVPGGPSSTAWYYVTEHNGEEYAITDSLPAGNYTMGLYLNDGYDLYGEVIPFTVVDAAAAYPASGESGNALIGTVIGNETGWGGNADAGAAAAFDGNPATFFDPLGQGDGYCGMDMGRKVVLDKVVILSRADWNARFKGAEIRGN
ncbi:MAG: hypothetical protein IKQ92_08825, partial [Clostridia bacterium]|nr:hypothetical protein [Clostridia bacterium]